MKDIKEGLQEIHNILTNDCRFVSKEFTKEFLTCLEAQSKNKLLYDICNNIIQKNKNVTLLSHFKG